MSRKKILRIIGIAAGAFILFAFVGSKAKWFGNNYAIKVAVEKPLKRTIIETITANGKIQPATEVKISADVSGEIVELNVIEGQEVKKGDLLLKINPDIYLSSLDRMEATLNSAKSNYANAKARLAQVKAQFSQAELNFNRNKKLFEQNAISQAEFDNVTSAYEVAKAEVEAADQTVNASHFQVKSSEASLNEAKENLKKTSIFAPVSGTISKLNVEKGERVVGTMQMTGTEIMRIANLNKMDVVVDVNENDIVRVEIGDTAIIEVDAYFEKKFKGVVTEIANSASISGTGTDVITNFTVKVQILPDSYQFLIPSDKPNHYPFRPGMTATTEIQTETKHDVWSIPIQSVTTRADSTGNPIAKSEMFEKEENQTVTKETNTDNKTNELKEVIFIYSEGKAKMLEIKTGTQDNNYIEIITDITPETEIITAPYSAISKQLSQNKAVLKVKKEELFQQNK